MTTDPKTKISFERVGGGKFGRIDIDPVNVCMLVVLDATASRGPTIDQFKQSFKAQMADAKEQLIQLGSLGEVRVIISYFSSNQVIIRNPVTLDKIPDELDRISCVSGETKIAQTLREVKDLKAQLPEINAVLFIGDTTDGRNDTLENLRKAGFDFGKNTPIVTLLDKTEGQHGTRPETFTRMKALSEASGVPGCPIAYDRTIYAFRKQVLPIMIASAGTPVLEEARAKDMIPAEAAGGVAAEVLDKIAKPLPFWRREGALKFNFNWKKPLAIGGIAALFGLLSQCPHQKKTAPDPGPAPNSIVVVPSYTAHFAFDSSTLPPNDEAGLKEFANGVKDLTQGRVVVTGHADDTGPTRYNDQLSIERAARVAALLKANGIRIPIGIQGLGEAGAKPATREQDRNAQAQYDPTYVP